MKQTDDRASIHYRTTVDRKQYLIETAAAQGCTINDIVNKLVDEKRSSGAKLDTLEIRRRQVVKDLEDTTEKLAALRKKLKTAETKERRLGIIAQTLILTYPKLNMNWKLIRLRALEDLRHKPDWSKQLNIKSRLEIDLACDQAQKVTDLTKLKKSLEKEDEDLNRKMATDTEAEDASSAAQRMNQESNSSAEESVKIPELWPQKDAGTQ
jgi:predicted ribosome quality control (RQC) complex YloA/Tae2 family protein